MGNLIDTTLNWEFTTNNVGSIDSAGFFRAEEEGLGFLRVFIGDGSDIATVIVQDSSLDSTGIQTIKIIPPIAISFDIDAKDGTLVHDTVYATVNSVPEE